MTRLVKIGAKVTRHSKYVTFQLAEVTPSITLLPVPTETTSRRDRILLSRRVAGAECDEGWTVGSSLVNRWVSGTSQKPVKRSFDEIAGQAARLGSERIPG